MQRSWLAIVLICALLRLSGNFLIVPGDLWMLTDRALRERQQSGLCAGTNHTGKLDKG